LAHPPYSTAGFDDEPNLNHPPATIFYWSCSMWLLPHPVTQDRLKKFSRTQKQVSQPHEMRTSRDAWAVEGMPERVWMCKMDVHHWCQN